MSDRDTTRSGEALRDSGADGSGVVASSDDRPLEWVYESPIHGKFEILHYELKEYSKDGRRTATAHTLIWLKDSRALHIESEIRDPRIIEGLLTAYVLGRHAGRQAERRAALHGAGHEL